MTVRDTHQSSSLPPKITEIPSALSSFLQLISSNYDLGPYCKPMVPSTIHNNLITSPDIAPKRVQIQHLNPPHPRLRPEQKHTMHIFHMRLPFLIEDCFAVIAWHTLLASGTRAFVLSY
jgi:hypothetical protein